MVAVPSYVQSYIVLYMCFYVFLSASHCMYIFIGMSARPFHVAAAPRCPRVNPRSQVTSDLHLNYLRPALLIQYTWEESISYLGITTVLSRFFHVGRLY